MNMIYERDAAMYATHTRMVSEWKKNSVYEQIPTAALPASGS